MCVLKQSFSMLIVNRCWFTESYESYENILIYETQPNLPLFYQVSSGAGLGSSLHFNSQKTCSRTGKLILEWQQLFAVQEPRTTCIGGWRLDYHELDQ